MDLPGNNDESRRGLTRRTVLGLFLATAVFPAVSGAYAQPAYASLRDVDSPFVPADALRRIEKTNLAFEQVAQIASSTHRVTFYAAAWDGGSAYVRDLEIKSGSSWLTVLGEDQRFDEQWVVLTSADAASPDYYYAAATPNWVALQTISQLSATTVELTAAASGVYDITVRWNVDAAYPEVQYVLTARSTQNYIVGYQSVDVISDADAVEVLCGSLQHSQVIKSTTSLGAWELFAPMSLVERTSGSAEATLGVFVPADVMAFEHDRALGSDRQPYGMSLRNDSGDVNPTAYAPQAGLRSAMSDGDTASYAFGIAARLASLYDTYVDICRNDQGYVAYRENVYGTSLTGAVFNMIELAAIDPDGGDSDFVPSFSGWWQRAKGFVDMENDDAVRTSAIGILLSAFYLTSAPSDFTLYDNRALPTIEYALSRRSNGFTPIPGKPIYGSSAPATYALGGYPFDSSVLVPLWEMTKNQNAGIHRAAKDVIATIKATTPPRTPMSNAYQAYVMSGDPARLAQATAEGTRFADEEILTPYTVNVNEGAFAYTYSKSWIELVLLYELTGNANYLTAAHTEVRRFVTQTAVRPVPTGNVDAPSPTAILSAADGWDGDAYPSYPQSTVSPESVAKWVVSNSGMTFEQLLTFKIGDSTTPNPGGGYVQNPCWAPFLLRLGYYTGDDFIMDVAHNLIVGRFTNYPGYYNRQYLAADLKPDFPLQGPPQLSAIYYHHIPSQVGIALDYLFSEAFVRSSAAIDFPSEFECTFVYFKQRVYGHKPGTFYGDENVWPYFPFGSITVDSAQVNWISGVGNGNLYVALANESTSAVTTTLTFDQTLTGVSSGTTYSAAIIDAAGTRTSASVVSGQITVTVPARGLVSLVITNAGVPAPWHWTPDSSDVAYGSYAYNGSDSGSDFGISRAYLLMRPDRSGMDAYIQCDFQDASTLTYSVNGGEIQTAPAKAYPYEWTIRLDNLTDTINYQISSSSVVSPSQTLKYPPAITGICPAGTVACGELYVPDSTTPGDTIQVRGRVRTSSATALTGFSITPTVPTGWTVSGGSGPTTVPTNGTVDWTWNVSVPSGATIGNNQISAQAHWSGGTTALTIASVEVLQPQTITAIAVDPTTGVNAGEAVTISIALLNSGPTALSGTMTVSAPSGWTLSSTTVPWSAAARSEVKLTVTATSSASATPDKSYTFVATLGSSSMSTTVMLWNPAETVITAEDIYPDYYELGTWLTSGLVGFNGTMSRYNGASTGSILWTPDLPAADSYEVFVWYPTNSGSTTSAQYTIHHSSGDTVVTVNQQTGGGAWRSLGSYSFGAGRDGYLRLDVTSSDFNRVSAARFLRS